MKPSEALQRHRGEIRRIAEANDARNPRVFVKEGKGPKEKGAKERGQRGQGRIKCFALPLLLSA